MTDALIARRPERVATLQGTEGSGAWVHLDFHPPTQMGASRIKLFRLGYGSGVFFSVSSSFILIILPGSSLVAQAVDFEVPPAALEGRRHPQWRRV